MTKIYCLNKKIRCSNFTYKESQGKLLIGGGLSIYFFRYFYSKNRFLETYWDFLFVSIALIKLLTVCLNIIFTVTGILKRYHCVAYDGLKLAAGFLSEHSKYWFTMFSVNVPI